MALVQSREYGIDREMLPLALARMKDPRSTAILTELLEDNVVAAHALEALRRRAGDASLARERVIQLLRHPDQRIQREAKKTLAAIDKAGL